MVYDSLISSNCYMKFRGNSSDAVAVIRLNDPKSEVDVTKYQQVFLVPLLGKA